jgi:hypothetical protein
MELDGPVRAVRGRWPLMLRTGWVVVWRMIRMSPSPQSMARVAYLLYVAGILVSSSSTNKSSCSFWQE